MSGMTKGNGLALVLVAASWAYGGNLTVDKESVFSVVTHKSGFTGLGHNHLIVATPFEADLTVNAENLAATQLSLSFDTKNLQADDPNFAKSVFPHIKAAGILDEAFHEQSESNRKKITKSMFSKKQLDVDGFPKISAKLVAVKAKPVQMGTRSYSHELEVAVTIRGVTKNLTFNGTLKLDGGVFTLEAVTATKFTDFGIKPYSAMLGGVANKDGFHIFVKMKAK